MIHIGTINVWVFAPFTCLEVTPVDNLGDILSQFGPKGIVDGSYTG